MIEEGVEEMITPNKQLRQNPFTTYRDPMTGKWVVVKPQQPKAA